MDDFDILLTKMVKEGKANRNKPKTRKSKLLTDKVGRQSGMQAAHNPWTDEALVLVSTNIICDNCGNEALGWEASLYIERKNARRKNPITQIEKLEACAYSSVYGALPKRVEILVKHSCTCPLCFGIGDNRVDELTGKMAPVQLALNLTEN